MNGHGQMTMSVAIATAFLQGEYTELLSDTRE